MRQNFGKLSAGVVALPLSAMLLSGCTGNTTPEFVNSDRAQESAALPELQTVPESPTLPEIEPTQDTAQPSAPELSPSANDSSIEPIPQHKTYPKKKAPGDLGKKACWLVQGDALCNVDKTGYYSYVNGITGPALNEEYVEVGDVVVLSLYGMRAGSSTTSVIYRSEQSSEQYEPIARFDCGMDDSINNEKLDSVTN